MNLSKGYIYFIVARIIGLLVKPILLMYLLNNEMTEDAAQLSKVYLLLGGVFVLYHVPVHFEYYKLYFEYNYKFIRLRHTFNEYLENLFYHVFLFLPIVFLISNLLLNDYFFALLMTISLLVEKIFDEIQRFLQFSKKFITWSNIFLFKNLIPFLIVFVFIKFNWGNIIILYIISTIISIFIILILTTSFKFLEYIAHNIFQKLTFRKVIRYLLLLKNKYFLKFLQGISTSNILNIDKWIASLLYTKSLLSELTLMGQIGNSITVGMNYMTITNRRSDLLKSNNNLSSLMLGWKVPFIAVLFAAIVIFLIFNINSITSGITELNFHMMLFIIFSYTIYAISAPLTEYLFWNIEIKKILFIDFIYFLFMIICGIVLYFSGNYLEIAVYFFIAHLLRCIMLLILIYKMEKN